MRILQSKFCEIADTLGALPPEHGGVLGADAEGVITEYYFDYLGRSASNGYAPDIDSINEVLANKWMPEGIFMVGIVHSHSANNRVPSCGDISYGINILNAIDTVDYFYLPILTRCADEVRLDSYTIRKENGVMVCRKDELRLV